MRKLIIGMLTDTIRGVFQKPATEKYPIEKIQPEYKLRGRLEWDSSHCTGCGLCVKDCPSNAIELITIDKENKQFVMRHHVDRCAFCDQCVQNCRFNCLQLSSDTWELASCDRSDFDLYYGDEQNVRTALAENLI